MRSFPWDSIVEAMGEDGFPIYNRSYDASDIREAFTVTQGEGVDNNLIDNMREAVMEWNKRQSK